MFLQVNITRLMVYGLLFYGVYVSDLPWWLVVALILWDNPWYKIFVFGKQARAAKKYAEDQMRYILPPKYNNPPSSNSEMLQ